MRRHFHITKADGVVLDAIAQGPANEMPLVLLHGLSDSWKSFEPLLARMPEDQAVVAISHRGHGASSKPKGAGAYRAASFVDDLRALLAMLDQERAIFVGHSLGAWVASHFAVQCPDRVGGLALICGFARFGGNPAVDELRCEVDQFTDPVDPAFVRSFQEAASSPDLPADFMDMIVAESLGLPAHVWRGVLSALTEDDVPDDFAGFAAPARLIWGDRDLFVPYGDQRVHCERIRTAELSIYAGAGHSPHWERPAEVARELVAFASLCDQTPLHRAYPTTSSASSSATLMPSTAAERVPPA